jgi:crotonobetainyl-CoA:carnitine CoA-transferase CaiB-like acyl-CoA transferase
MPREDASDTPAEAPLTGLRVVDLSVTLPGPYCSQVLRRLGASVLHLEPPGGDTLRWVAPTSFAFLAQGKESVVVDLKDPVDLALALAQLAEADVVIQGWRPGVANKLGVGYEQVASLNPRVVYASLSGYGEHGVKARHPGHDVNYAAEAGAVDLVQVNGLPVGDLAGASVAAIRVLASVIRALRTGEGSLIEVSITGALMQWVEAVGGVDYQQFLKVYSAPHYGIFDLADGERIALGVAQEERLWANLISALGRPEWATLPYRSRVEDAERIQEYIAKTLKSMTSAEAVVAFEAVDTCWNLVQRPGQTEVSEGLLPNPGGRVPAPDEHGDSYRRAQNVS